MAWQCISPGVNVNSFKKCCISSAVGLMIVCCGMTVKRVGMLGMSWEDEGTD
jgi:hypothetical protein